MTWAYIDKGYGFAVVAILAGLLLPTLVVEAQEPRGLLERTSTVAPESKSVTIRAVRNGPGELQSHRAVTRLVSERRIYNGVRAPNGVRDFAH
jgi:hypothetical protein